MVDENENSFWDEAEAQADANIAALQNGGDLPQLPVPDENLDPERPMILPDLEEAAYREGETPLPPVIQAEANVTPQVKTKIAYFEQTHKERGKAIIEAKESFIGKLESEVEEAKEFIDSTSEINNSSFASHLSKFVNFVDVNDRYINNLRAFEAAYGNYAKAVDVSNYSSKQSSEEILSAIDEARSSYIVTNASLRVMEAEAKDNDIDFSKNAQIISDGIKQGKEMLAEFKKLEGKSVEAEQKIDKAAEQAVVKEPFVGPEQFMGPIQQEGASVIKKAEAKAQEPFVGPEQFMGPIQEKGVSLVQEPEVEEINPVEVGVEALVKEAGKSNAEKALAEKELAEEEVEVAATIPDKVKLALVENEHQEPATAETDNSKKFDWDSAKSGDKLTKLKDLRRGYSQHTDQVEALQRILIKGGFMDQIREGEFGYFGEKTETAVEKMQQAFKDAGANISVDGIVYTQGWAATAAIYEIGTRDGEITAEAVEKYNELQGTSRSIVALEKAGEAIVLNATEADRSAQAGNPSSNLPHVAGEKGLG